MLNLEIVSQDRMDLVTPAELAELRASDVSWLIYTVLRATMNHADAMAELIDGAEPVRLAA